MLPKYIDIHSHLHFSAFDEDREEVLQRTLAEKVWMINVGTQKDTSKTAVDFANKYNKGVYATVGLHPIHTDKSYHDKQELGGDGKSFTSRGEHYDKSFYHSMAMSEKVVAIGEVGLDYYRCTSETEQKQKQAFIAQIELANEINKPLMLHVRSGSGRSAYLEALEILKMNAKVSGNFHFFAGNPEEAKEILNAGFYLSFTGVITFARDYDEVIRNAPLDRIMSETDCPYVSPAPFRGKRNEPLNVREVVKKIAEIRGEDFEKVRETLVNNALDFFKLEVN